MIEKLEKLLLEVKTKLHEVENQLCALNKVPATESKSTTSKTTKTARKRVKSVEPVKTFDEFPEAVGECPEGYTVFGSSGEKCRPHFEYVSYKTGDKCPTCGHQPPQMINQEVVADCERDKNSSSGYSKNGLES